VAHAEGSIAIEGPAEAAFNFILDGLNNPLWRPSVLDIQRTTGQSLGVGASYKQGIKGPGGSRIDGDYKIVECQPNRLIRFNVTSGPARPTGIYKFEARDGMTWVTLFLDYQPKGLAWLMDSMVEKAMQGEIAVLSNLKVYLESHT